MELNWLDALSSGMRSPDDQEPFPALRDIHVGVVSTDMGVPGVVFGPNDACDPNGGDDGRLRHAPHGDDCDSAYPTFLSFDPMTDRTKLANDLRCIASLGRSEYSIVADAVIDRSAAAEFPSER